MVEYKSCLIRLVKKKQIKFLFWKSFPLFLNIVSFEGNTLRPARFQFIHSFRKSRFFKVAKYVYGIDDFFIGRESLPTEPGLQVREQKASYAHFKLMTNVSWATFLTETWYTLVWRMLLLQKFTVAPSTRKLTLLIKQCSKTWVCVKDSGFEGFFIFSYFSIFLYLYFSGY